MLLTDIIKKYSPVPVTEEQAAEMEKFYLLLCEKNAVMNLTAIGKNGTDGTDGETAAAVLHFVDSLYVLSTGFVKGQVIDVGSGAGFPGVPVAAASSVFVTCLDATGKKADFIAEATAFAGIKNVKALCGRAEELAITPQFREKYDAALSRAVAKLNILCEWCLPFVKTGGFFIAMKSADIETETAAAQNAISVLGGKLADIQYYNLPVTGRRRALVVIEKRRPTLPEYPRKNSVILKRPL